MSEETVDREIEQKLSGRKKPVAIESLDQLLSEAYSGKFSRSSLKKQELRGIRKTLEISEERSNELLESATSDRKLVATRRLLQIGLSINERPVSKAVIEFVRKVINRHPLFQSGSGGIPLSEIAAGVSEELFVKKLLEAVIDMSVSESEEKPLTKREIDQCKVNGVACAILMQRADRNLSLNRIYEILKTSLWGPATKKVDLDEAKIIVLLSNKDAQATVVAGEIFDVRIRDATQQAHRAERSAERANARLGELEKKMAELHQELESSEGEVEKLRNRLQTEITEYKDRITLLQDDFEQLKGRVLSRLKQEIALLDDGLHALRREPPKTHVMVDHAERAIDGLKQELDRLREWS